MLTIELRKGYNFKSAIPLTIAAIQKAFAGLSVVLTGTVGTGDIASGAITDAKSTPGAYWHDHAATWNSGTSTYSVTVTPSVPALSSGVLISFKAPSACAGATKLDVSLLGAKPIYRQDATAVLPGDIHAGQIVEVRYDAAASPSGAWILTSAPAREQQPFAIAAGTSSAVVATFTPAYQSLGELDGVVLRLMMPSAPAAAATLNVDGLGAKSIVYGDGSGDAVAAGEWAANEVVEVLYTTENDRFEMLHRNRNRIWYATDSGTANSYVLAVTRFPTAYVAGQRIAWKSTTTPTGACTVAVNGMAAKALKRNGVAIAPGIIKANEWLEAIYDGTDFQLLNKDGWIASAETALLSSAGGQVLNITHGLGVTPSKARGVLVCRKAGGGGVLGFADGEEIECMAVYEGGSGAYFNLVSIRANATNISAVQTLSMNATYYLIPNQSTWQWTQITLADWRFKLYYAP